MPAELKSNGPRIVSRDEWLAARLDLLRAEKDLTRRSDELARQRRALPWVCVDKNYVFDTNEGEKTLCELFDGRSQLLVYHFMFGPDWAEGCPACSFMADSFDRAIAHLNQRDVTMICASRAPLDRLNSYKRRMGWSFCWASTRGHDFNCDFGVSLPPNTQADMVRYNFTAPWQQRGQRDVPEEHAGMSAFVLREGVVYHTYSCYARGLEEFNVTYQLLDRAPEGRGEPESANALSWVRRRDQYDSAPPHSPTRSP
jgi:predicted dithiol-disulfide oxidoreductase (DUF899 family)